MKICTRCEREKPLEDFHKHVRHKDGHRTVCKICIKDDHPKAHAKQYGLTLEEYNALRNITKCEICGTDSPTGKWTTLHIDHDHITGRVRGMLCTSCNQGLGRFKDNIESLQNAITYLQKDCYE